MPSSLSSLCSSYWVWKRSENKSSFSCFTNIQRQAAFALLYRKTNTTKAPVSGACFHVLSRKASCSFYLYEKTTEIYFQQLPVKPFTLDSTTRSQHSRCVPWRRVSSEHFSAIAWKMLANFSEKHKQSAFFATLFIERGVSEKLDNEILFVCTFDKCSDKCVNVRSTLYKIL